MSLSFAVRSGDALGLGVRPGVRSMPVGFARCRKSADLCIWDPGSSTWLSVHWLGSRVPRFPMSRKRTPSTPRIDEAYAPAFNFS